MLIDDSSVGVLVSDPSFTFVDLFAGIGGFTAALRALGGQCVYAVETDKAAAKVYELNWGHDPLGDITLDATDEVMNVGPHDVLAAGFPCQPFTKGSVGRAMDATRGTRYWNIMQIVAAHHPKVVLLETVINLAGPRHCHEWQIIIETLRAQGYHVSDEPALLSPHLLPLERGGRPQVRERVFITATYDPHGLGVSPPEPAVTRCDPRGGEAWDLARDLPLEQNPVAELNLSEDEVRWIDAWDDWVQAMWQRRAGDSDARLPGFPVWVDSWVHEDDLRIPGDTPAWKENFLRKNSALYTANHDVFDAWVKKWSVETFPPQRRKFEWHARSTPRLWDCIIQLRPSGIRARPLTYVPALVGIFSTSIVGPQRRRLSPREAAWLQGLPDAFDFGDQRFDSTYRQIGNTANVGVVQYVLHEHVRRDERILRSTAPELVAAVLHRVGTFDKSPRQFARGRSDGLKQPADEIRNAEVGRTEPSGSVADNRLEAPRRTTGIARGRDEVLAAGGAENFNPAETLPEAAARIFAITRSRDSGSRGPKRALVALAESLGVEVDLGEVNAVLGGQIAEELGVAWREERDYTDLQVTVTGMNTLLRAATESLARLSRESRIGDRRAADVLVAFPGFRPARNKQEAVNRMCELAGVPADPLGPGGKEHTWTLRDLARRLAPEVLDRERTKHELAAALCDAFGVPWLASAGSTGASITLDGLNLILAGAERRAQIVSAGWPTAQAEGSALIAALSRGLHEHWDGRASIREMRQSGSTQWRQMEWAGFYFEEKAREVLNGAHPTPPVGGPRVRFGNTVFDYASATRVWDAKAHTAMRVLLPNGVAHRDSKDAVSWLNDARAMRECVELQGLGFLVVEGLSSFDTTDEFKEWHKAFGATGGKKAREYVPSTGRSRPRKAAFTPLELRAIWIENTHDLDAGIAGGWLSQEAQPDWEGTVARNDKFKARFARAKPWQVAHYEWPKTDE